MKRPSRRTTALCRLFPGDELRRRRTHWMSKVHPPAGGLYCRDGERWIDRSRSRLRSARSLRIRSRMSDGLRELRLSARRRRTLENKNGLTAPSIITPVRVRVNFGGCSFLGWRTIVLGVVMSIPQFGGDFFGREVARTAGGAKIVRCPAGRVVRRAGKRDR